MLPHRRKDGCLVVPADALAPDGTPLLGGPVRLVLPGDPDFAFWDEFAVDSDSDWSALLAESDALRLADESP